MARRSPKGEERQLWGRVLGPGEAGGLRVLWYAGPDRDEVGYEADLPRADCHPALLAMPAGACFLGGGLVTPGRVRWAGPPVEVEG